MTERCRPFTLPSGEVVRVRGERPMDARDAAALAEVITAARALAAADPDLERRQAEGRARIAALRARVTKETA